MSAVWKLAVAVVTFAPVLGRAADPTPVATQTPPRRLAPEHPLDLYDLRVVQASPGKLDALHARIRDHQIPTLEQHGIWTLAVFVPAGENTERYVYLLTAAKGLGAMTDGWAGFRGDSTWQEVLAETDKDGRLAAQEGYQRLRRTPWSPLVPVEQSARPRVFELRTYMSPTQEKRAALTRRFRNHTMKLFAKHGMQNIVYWIPDEGEPDVLRKLVYLLAHDSIDAAQKSFAAFRADPEWLAAKKASEDLAGGSLTDPEKGVVSQFLVPTDYSPLK